MVEGVGVRVKPQWFNQRGRGLVVLPPAVMLCKRQKDWLNILGLKVDNIKSHVNSGHKGLCYTIANSEY